MKKEEHDLIYDHLRQRIIVIPNECMILRFRDVSHILETFLEQDDPTKTNCPLCHGSGKVSKADTSKDVQAVAEETE